jgi:NTE family protein
MSQTRGVDPEALQNPPSWWRWILSGAWKRGPPIVSVLMRSATITTDAEMGEARGQADVLVLPDPGGSDIRDWKVYDGPVAAGHAAMRAALADLPCPVTDLRHCAKSDPAETQAAE